MSDQLYRGYILRMDTERGVLVPYIANTFHSAEPQLGTFTSMEAAKRGMDIYRDAKPHLSVSL